MIPLFRPHLVPVSGIAMLARATSPSYAVEIQYAMDPDSSFTNSQLRSEELDNVGVWSQNQLTVTANDTTAPDGTATAEKLVETAVSNFHFLNGSTVAVTTGQTVAISCYFKAGTRSKADIRFTDTATSTKGFKLVLDLATGTVTTFASIGASWGVNPPFNGYLVVPIQNGWYRFTGFATSSSTENYRLQILMLDDTGTESYLGVITKNIYAWGAQVELNSSGTTYIKTTGATATRASATWLALTTLPPGTAGSPFMHQLPIDGLSRYYRARQTDGTTGGRTSPWLSCRPISGKPTQISGVTPLLSVAAQPAEGSIVQPAVATGTRYKARVYNSAPESIANNSITSLTWDSELFDVGSLHSTSSNTDRMTIPATNTAGLWIAMCTVLFAPNATGYRYIEIRSNTLGLLGYCNMVPVSGGANPTAIQVVGIINDPTPGDYLFARVLQNSGGALDALDLGGTAAGFFDLVHVW